MKRQLSGANVSVNPWFTYKRGEHVDWQMRYQTRANLLVPGIAPSVVFRIGNAAIMKTGKPVVRWDWREAENSLSRIWQHQEPLLYDWPQPRFTEHALKHFLLLSPCWHMLEPFLVRLRNYAMVNAEATHGDCTHENTLLSPTGAYQFIDWQPFRRPFIPADRDVDYGKMLQSLLGFRLEQGVEDWYSAVTLAQEHPYAVFWCAVHFERIRRRVQVGSGQEVLCVDRIKTCVELMKENKIWNM